jgi:hypothetical protein
MKILPGLTFSPRRALGITALRRGVARAIGIPTTRGGIERKVGRALLALFFGRRK